MILGMSQEEFRRAAGIWGIALCVLSAATGWIFVKFGVSWSLGDLPSSEVVYQVVPAYVVMEVAFIPIGGKLVDRIGVRKVLAFAPSLYILGSMMCMISNTFDLMVVSRLIQGIGGGLVLGMAFSAVGKYYDPDKRSKAHELLTIAFALGSLFGSGIGYFISDNFGWRVGFIVFSVIMLVGFVIAWIFIPDHDHSDSRADPLGLVFAAGVFGLAALYTQMVNVTIDLISWQSFLMAGGIVVLVILLLRHCNRSEDPAIPVRISMFEKKMILLMFMFSLCGLGLIQYFFKLYLTYYEFDIYKASFMFLALLAGAAGPSIIGGKMVYRTGAMPWIIAGSGLVTIGLMLTNLVADKGTLGFAASLFVIGMGLGCIVTEILCSVQTVVPKKNIGQHTGNLMAVRMVGILTGNALVGTYISNIVDAGKDRSPIDLANVDVLVEEVLKRITDGIHSVAQSLDTGFLMTVIIMAMVTVMLTGIAHTLGRDDAEAVKAFNEAKEKGEEEQRFHGEQVLQ